MFASIRYVLTENFQNLYRIYCIAKYELLADMRDSKFGIFWNFASPAIQVLTYWFIFGFAWSKAPLMGLLICRGWLWDMRHGGLFSRVFRVVVMLYFQKPVLLRE